MKAKVKKKGPNKKLLRQTLAFIKKHPDRWNQMPLRCGTVCCFAGHASLLAGGKWAYPKDYMDSTLEATKTRPEEDAWNRGQAVLRLTENQADDLFSGDNTFKDLTKIVNRLAK